MLAFAAALTRLNMEATHMLAMRELTEKEMALVAGGWFLSSDPGPGDGGSWWGSATNPFDVSLGSTSSGWSFGVSYADNHFGIWTQDPSGQQTYHVLDNGTVNGTINVPFGDNNSGTFQFNFDTSNGGSVGVGVEWHW